MKLLILGGTKFLGRHVVEAAVARGHDVTIFARGETNPGVYPEVRRIAGDRTAGLGAAAGESWDAVIDTWALIPSMVRASAQALAARTGRYQFVSSLSVFAPGTPPGFDETTPAQDAAGPDEPWDPERYGALKVACEQAAEVAMPGRVSVVRPGLIVGPHDPSDRFTYWPARFARGGTVLAPGRPDRPVQIVHGRDLAELMISLVEHDHAGIVHATGPATPFADVLAACATASGASSTIVWAADDWLLSHGVEPWIEMPVWLPDDSEFAFLLSADVSKAAAAGLRCRSLEQTARETLEWDRSRGDGPREAGLAPEKEASLLAML